MVMYDGYKVTCCTLFCTFMLQILSKSFENAMKCTTVLFDSNYKVHSSK